MSFYRFWLGWATEILLLSKDEGLKDIGHKLSMVLDTRIVVDNNNTIPLSVMIIMITLFVSQSLLVKILVQKQPYRPVLKKRCSKNMQQICRRTPMLKYDLNNVAKQLYWNHTLTWVSCKFVGYFQTAFS